MASGSIPSEPHAASPTEPETCTPSKSHEPITTLAIVNPTRGIRKGSSRLTLTDRVRKVVCEHRRDNPTLSQSAIMAWLRETHGITVTQSTISNTLRRSPELLNNAKINYNVKTHRTVKYPDLEQAMLDWVQVNKGQVTITGDLMKETGMQLFAKLYPNTNPFGFSNGWLDRFKKRHRILSRKPAEQNRELEEPPLLVICDQGPNEGNGREAKVSHEEAAKMLDRIDKYWLQQPNDNETFVSVIQNMREQVAIASGNISEVNEESADHDLLKEEYINEAKDEDARDL